MEVTNVENDIPIEFQGELTFGFSGQWQMEIESQRTENANESKIVNVLVKPRLENIQAQVVEYEFPEDAKPLYPLYDGKNSIWVSDPSAPRLWEFSLDTQEFSSYSFDGSSTTFLTMDNSGKIWFTDTPGNQIGYIDLNLTESPKLASGEVGYVVTGAKDLSQIRVGDTLVDANDDKPIILSGYKEPQPTVFSSIYPSDSDDYTKLRDSLDKYVLNDASFIYEPETSSAFGFGFRCGFLGLLHLEIVIERLEREFGLSLIVTPPSVEFKIVRNNEDEIIVRNPSKIDEFTYIKNIQERICELDLLFPKQYLGSIMKLLNEKRGTQLDLVYLSSSMVKAKYTIPLLELVSGFYDSLKSISQGFASLDYKILDFEKGNLVKLDILVNGEIVDSFSSILSKENSELIGRKRVKKLSELIPRQQFDIPIQAAIGSRIIARETIKALRKDVTAKLYGGDVTRKRKLLEKQKEGKKKMRNIGKVEVPKEAFREFLKE